VAEHILKYAAGNLQVMQRRYRVVTRTAFDQLQPTDGTIAEPLSELLKIWVVAPLVADDERKFGGLRELDNLPDKKIRGAGRISRPRPGG